MRLGLIIAAGLACGGCAHVLEIIDNQEIETSNIRKDMKGREGDTRLITIGGARRLIRANYADGIWTVCAETQADAIAARKSSTDASLADRGTMKDEIEEALTTTYTRTELSDAVRQLSWHLCNSRANAFLDNAEYKGAMTTLLNGTIATLTLRAGSDKAELEKVKKELDAVNQKLKVLTDCIAKGGSDAAKLAACKT